MNRCFINRANVKSFPCFKFAICKKKCKAVLKNQLADY